MLEIYDHGANSNLFQPIAKQIPTPPKKMLGFEPGTPVFLSQHLAVLTKINNYQAVPPSIT